MIAIANTVPYFETITSAIRLAGLDASGFVGGGVSAAVTVLMLQIPFRDFSQN
jgi:hypothetical protein